MVVLTMDIVETTGRLVVEGGDRWWSSILVESAGCCYSC